MGNWGSTSPTYSWWRGPPCSFASCSPAPEGEQPVVRRPRCLFIWRDWSLENPLQTFWTLWCVGGGGLLSWGWHYRHFHQWRYQRINTQAQNFQTVAWQHLQGRLRPGQNQKVMVAALEVFRRAVIRLPVAHISTRAESGWRPANQRWWQSWSPWHRWKDWWLLKLLQHLWTPLVLEAHSQSADAWHLHNHQPHYKWPPGLWTSMAGEVKWNCHSLLAAIYRKEPS